MSEIRITVFGGSLPQPGSSAYEEAFRLGQLLGAQGFTVLTGGYIGTMEAVSRGAAEAGAHVIGVTCDEIEAWRPVAANRWVMEEYRFPTLRERLFSLIENCDAALALPGGIGTLAEIAVMWSQLQTRAIASRPLILIGAGWQRVFDTLYQEQGDYINSTHRGLLLFAATVEEALESLNNELQSYSSAR